MSDPSLVVGIIGLGLSAIVIVYEKNSKEIKNLEDSIDKYYIPLLESIKSHPLEKTNEMTLHRNLADKETIKKLKAYISDLEKYGIIITSSGQTIFDDKTEQGMSSEEERKHYNEWNLHTEQITYPMYIDLIEHIETTIENKEKRLSDLRNKFIVLKR
jgi:hypothetical protein